MRRALGCVLLASLGVGVGCHLVAGIEDGTAACPVDGQRNGLEVGVDCGGPCAPCPDGARCERHEDCSNNACYAACPGPTCDLGMVCQPPDCEDGRRNGSETDIDCGGDDDNCDRCYGGDTCLVDDDCGAPQTDGRHTCVEGRCLSSCCGDDCGAGCGCTAEDIFCCDDLCPSGGLGTFCTDVDGPYCQHPLTCYYDDPTDGECW